jgi:hypothetical protein
VVTTSSLLEQAVLEYLASDPHFFDDLVKSPIFNPQKRPPAAAFATIEEEPPEPLDPRPRIWDPNARVVPIDFVRLDAENRRLGELGEEFVYVIDMPCVL